MLAQHATLFPHAFIINYIQKPSNKIAAILFIPLILFSFHFQHFELDAHVAPTYPERVLTPLQIEQAVTEAWKHADGDSLIFKFLLAYGLPKSSVSRLESGALNAAARPGELLWKKKLFYKRAEPGLLMSAVDSCRRDPEVLKYAPRFIIVCDGGSWAAADMKTGEALEFPLKDLPRHYDFFLPWAGMEKTVITLENPADVRAAEKMGKIFDSLKKDNPGLDSHAMNVFMARLLFCFFAEDSGIFEEERLFTDFIERATASDGSDLREQLERAFAVMNLPPGSPERAAVPISAARFPYVNGGLFQGAHAVPRFSSRSRKALIDAGNLDWSDINTDIFGNMFQACVAPDKRSCLGEHYTSVPNIMKVLRPLFLEELENAARQARGHEARARKFIERLSNIRFFDPACGSGNFLIVAFKEVRRLEMEVLESVPALLPMPSVSISQFYGIEIDDFAHEIAMLSLWLAEHQMNQEFFERLGKRVPTLPLRPNEHIVLGNALRLDWETVCPKTAPAQAAPLWTVEPLLQRAAPDVREPEIYIFGNPPYLGSKMQSVAQKEEVKNIYGNSNSENISNLDYVCGWIGLGAEFIAGSPYQCAFVTTNSITQGEQVGPVWDLIFKKNIEISFAYTSFKWTNNAKYQAGVTCVIIGLRRKHVNSKSFIYNENKVKEVDKISPYLIPGSPVIVRRTKKPVTKKFPPMVFGSMPRDGGHLILTEEEYHEVVNKEQESISFIKRFSGSQEFIRGTIRYCFWIAPEQISQARKIFEIRKRLDLVSKERKESKAPSTRAYADRPYLFVQRAYKPTDSIIIPAVSSERREYIPMGYLDKDTVISNSAFAVYDAEPWVFGILTSRMHMAWVRVTCGRLKTDYRYSATLCYNTFPLRELTEGEEARVTEAALGVLDAREAHPEKTPAELYDPDRMPENLRQAHDRLDAEVDRLYRVKGFKDDGERLECLFELYREMTQGQQTE